MATNIAKYRDALEKLVSLGDEMLLDLGAKTSPGSVKLDKADKELIAKARHSFSKNYQRWYTESVAVVRQLIPDRLSEFESYYRTDQKRKTIELTTYRIQDWLTGVRSTNNAYTDEKHFDDGGVVLMLFHTQLDLLRSAQIRFESSLLDIRQVLQADLFDSEIDAARELFQSGFLRAAGVIGGVIVERHLSQVCGNHNVTVRKKQPTIGDLNDLLKAAAVIDVPAWRFIQRLGDLRNLASHNGEREPTSEEIEEMLAGVERITKTLY